MKKEQNLQEPQEQALSIPDVMNSILSELKQELEWYGRLLLKQPGNRGISDVLARRVSQLNIFLIIILISSK